MNDSGLGKAAREQALEAEVAELRRQLAESRQRDAEALRASEARLRLVLESSTEFAIITLDREGRVESWNAGARAITGWEEREMLGQPLDRIWLPEDVASGLLAEEMREARKHGSAPCERWHMRRDGGRFWARGMMMPMRGHNGALIGFLKMFRDDTERLRADAERQRLIDTIEQSPDFIGLARPDGGVVFLNEAGRRMIGFSNLEEARRSRIQDYFDPQDWSFVEQTILPSVMRNGAWTGEYRFRNQRTGEIIPVDYNLFATYDAQGGFAGLATVTRDIAARKQAEQSLRESEELKRRILQSSGDCIKVLDLDGRLRFVSEGGLRVMEIDDFAEFEDCPWLDFWQGEEAGKAQAAIEAARAGGTGRFEGRAPTAKGNMRWWDVVVTPILGADGRPEKLLSISRDVTVAREAQFAVAESEARLRQITDLSPAIIWFGRADGTLSFLNRRWSEYTGQALEEALPDGWTAVIYPDDLPALLHSWREARERGGLYEIESRIRRHDGAYRWFLIRAEPLRDAEDRITGWFGNDTEIHDRKMAEEALRALTTHLEQAVEARTRERDRVWQVSRDLIAVIDAEGVFRAANPAWTRILGWQPEEVTGRNFRDFIHPEDELPTKDALAHATRDVLAAFENRYRHKDGSYRWFSWMATPEAGLVYATGRDITEQRRTEEQLRQAQKMEAVGQLTGGIAHDFNNLLTGISGSLEILQARINQGRFNTVEKHVSAAQGAARRAAALTHRLLAFSRRQTLDPRPCNVNALIADMAELVRRTMGPEIIVEVVQAAGLWRTMCDANQLENALLNLCINARDAMPDGGRLTIETANRRLDERAARERDVPSGEYICVSVTDTGTGMTPDVIARAFDPFFTTKPLGMGTGLGLSMIYGFARQSGGQARIYSELGEGTTICIYLPRHGSGDAEAEAPAKPAAAPRPGQGETVLVVDDEPTVRMLVTEVLEDLGYVAIEAADGASGLRVLRSNVAIDLLITDVGLPGGMNGRQLAEAAREIRPGLRVLFITGYAENALIGNCHLQPDMHVLSKPFPLEILAGRIREIIAG